MQVTAGRRQEKVLEAPASITVLGAGEVEREVVQTSIRALRNVTAVDIVQTGIDRHEVVLRGFNNAFSGTAHVLTDYRQASAPVIAVNVHSVMPAIPLDIERVEVVRGPGAALYGPGVSGGVIHYLTQDAFSSPGVTVSVGGGQRSLWSFQGRAAGVVAGKLGIKVVGSYSSGNDFELENCDMELVEQKRFSECPDPVDAQQLYLDGVRDSRFTKSVGHTSLLYRFNDNTSLTFDAGFGLLDGVVLSGIGTIQGSESVSTHAQLRFNSGPFFAQAYLNGHDSGKSYIYNADPVVLLSSQANIQAQYNHNFGGDRQQMIFGVDLEFQVPESKGTIYGRYEDEDNTQEYGVYVQSETALGEKLDIVLALRSDYHSVFEEFWLSPRAALVFKPSLTSNFRVTFNRTISSPSIKSLFLDLVAKRLPLGDAYLPVRGRGSPVGYTWNRNPAYTQIGAPTDLVASSLLPGMEGADAPVGLPTGLVYGLMYQGIVDTPNEELAEALIMTLGLPESLLPLLTSQIDALKGLLHPEATEVEGFSPGQLGLLNLSSQAIDVIPGNNLAPVEGIKPSRSMMVEAGYKGILVDRVLFAVDAYYAEKQNFVGGLQMKTPFVLVPTLHQDLTRDLVTGIANNDELVTALDLLSLLAGIDLTPEAAARLLVDLAGSALPDASTPIGVVQPNENHAGVGNIPELLVAYPNFGHIRYHGVDVGLQVLASDDLSLFANLSWVNDDFFDNTETGEESPTAVVSLNAPATKFKFGWAYDFANGFSVNASGRYISGFRVISGQYIGDVEPYFLMDLGVGYALDNVLRIPGNLRFDLNISNVTDNVHREFIGAPKIGRLMTARLLYRTGR